MDNEYCYSNAKNRYYDACSEINTKENRIADLKNEKSRLLNELNQINSEIVKYTNALADLEEAIKMQGDIEQSCGVSRMSISEADTNFGNMAESSNAQAKSLNEIYKTDTQSKLSEVFVNFASRRSALNAKIAELQKQKKDTETAISLKDSEMKTAYSDIESLKSVKNSSSIDMEYYKKKMEE